ncbi:hypothetical protein CXG81DRAFT_13043 [Caulochytrium protostelioides]|uniref:H/ACA ribonucleoprotein complex subunit 2 n=1 Tax=Caulochytrium protostelioides TaxID=1555241 RepID=A0A4V1ITQ9_9FUNG|nr:13 kDa ribonucleo protein-associated protein [Caulochytrium protostelioides]RKP00592.1 hypothetical protein CXG81DRAFT_13043 [Caulochytrium protostelioides]|eukprot:RKP00592.1 hypothetical protein CXG81DRAFT_13043 [Caulochytrium protostelioides]
MSGPNPKAFPLASPALGASLMALMTSLGPLKQLKKGANETTKALNRNLSSLVLLAADVEPLEILLHLPLLCEDKNVPYVFVESKVALGRACGTSRPVVAACITTNEGGIHRGEIERIRLEVEKLLV